MERGERRELLPTQRINDTTRCRAMTMTKSTELTMMKVTTTMALNDRQTERLTDSRQTRLARQLAGALFKWNMVGGGGGQQAVLLLKWQLAGQLALAVTRQSGSIGSGMHEDMLCYCLYNFP